jgi:hypothetical protein
LTVKAEVPAPLTIEAGLNEQVGAGVTTGVMLQLSPTLPVNPFKAAIVIVEAEDTPAATEAGDSAEAATVKSGG